MQLFTIRTSSVITKTKLKVLDILGCSPKLSHTFSLVAIGFFFYLKENIFHFGYLSYFKA